MVLTLTSKATGENIRDLLGMLNQEGLDGRVIRGAEMSTINLIGDESRKMAFLNSLTSLPYVSAFNPVTSPYKVISREAHPDYNGDTYDGNPISKEIRAGPLAVGGKNKLAIIAGPCSVPLDKVIMREIAAAVKENGGTGLRGGAFKPRSDPYTFRGHEEPALELAREIADEYGLAFVTEPVRSKHIPLVIKYAHVLQIGARNANQGFYLDVADATAETKMPILAKRGLAQHLEATYLPLVLNIYDNQPQGNENVMLCLRGVQTATDATRFTLDAGDVPVIKDRTILPVVGDPSHSAGKAKYVIPHAKAYIASGVDALIVEIYPKGQKPLSDAAQAISFRQLEEIVQYAKLVGRM